MDTQNNNNQTNLVIKRQVQIESISKAIYLITDLFEKDEPLRLSLRRAVIECIEYSNKKESVSKLISTIKTGNNVGLISDMNASILLNVLNQYFQEIDILNEKDQVDISYLAASDIKEEINISVPTVINEKVVPSEVLKPAVPNTNITIHNNTQNIKTVNNISMDIGSRRKKILEIVKSRGAVTINEFMESIKGCSSKTIQRELTSLVLSGTLKKTGERRWSKYSLK